MTGIFRRVASSQAGRFIGFGLFNTITGYGLFIGLGLVMNPAIAYTVSYGVGLVLVTLFSNRVIYRGADSWRRRLAYLAWYLLVFAVGQAVVWAFRPEGFLDLLITSGALLMVTVPLTFLGGRLIFQTDTRSKPEAVPSETLPSDTVPSDLLRPEATPSETTD